MAVRLRIGEVARSQGLTIKALAQRAGVAYNTAHALATGRATRIDLDTLERICAALQVEPGDVLVRQPPADTVLYSGERFRPDSDMARTPEHRSADAS